MNRLEKTAAVCVALSFLLLAGVTTRRFILSRKPNPAALPRVKIGEKVKLPEFASEKAGHTLVMVISSGCEYCVNDLPFYRRLSVIRGASGGELRLVAALPEKTETARMFLANAGVTVDHVWSAAPAEVGVQLIPTLLLLDADGKLQKFWVGELNEDRRQDVLAVLAASCTACGRPVAAAPPNLPDHCLSGVITQTASGGKHETLDVHVLAGRDHDHHCGGLRVKLSVSRWPSGWVQFSMPE